MLVFVAPLFVVLPELFVVSRFFSRVQSRIKSPALHRAILVHRGDLSAWTSPLRFYGSHLSHSSSLTSTRKDSSSRTHASASCSDANRSSNRRSRQPHCAGISYAAKLWPSSFSGTTQTFRSLGFCFGMAYSVWPLVCAASSSLSRRQALRRSCRTVRGNSPCQRRTSRILVALCRRLQISRTIPLPPFCRSTDWHTLRQVSRSSRSNRTSCADSPSRSRTVALGLGSSRLLLSVSRLRSPNCNQSVHVRTAFRHFHFDLFLETQHRRAGRNFRTRLANVAEHESQVERNAANMATSSAANFTRIFFVTLATMPAHATQNHGVPFHASHFGGPLARILRTTAPTIESGNNNDARQNKSWTIALLLE